MKIESIINYTVVEALVRAEISEFLEKSLKENFRPDLIEITRPPQPGLGDFTVPCFRLAAKVGEKPMAVSQGLATEFNAQREAHKKNLIKKAQSAGPYLNFFIQWPKYGPLILKEILDAGDKFGQARKKSGQKIMVEYFSPNTNKPLSVGHLRNISIGYSLVQILRQAGHKVITGTLFNNRGIALCKAVVAYQKWGNHETPASAKIKPDHFVGKFYVKFCQEAKANPALEQEAKDCLVRWEKNDKEIIKIWKQLVGWVFEGFEQTLEKVRAGEFDEKYYEHKIYKQGKEIVFDGLKKGIFKKHAEGYIYAPLEQFGLADKILLRPDYTSLYIVQDIYLAELKDEHKLDQSIYVVGSEQELAFKQLFKILEMLGEKSKKVHLSHGLMRLPEGRIKSREGLPEGVDADSLLDRLDSLALEEVKKRELKISGQEAQKRAKEIALAALKYYILQINPKNLIVFDPKQSMAFTGKTGPYLQYVYARIFSVMKKAPKLKAKDADLSKLTALEEVNLINHLSQFPVVINQAAIEYDPSHLANYLFDLAQRFSGFYEKIPVLKAPKDVLQARLALISAAQTVIKKGLSLLGIEVLERM